MSKSSSKPIAIMLNKKSQDISYYSMKKVSESDHLHTEAAELYREFLKGDYQNKTGEFFSVHRPAWPFTYYNNKNLTDTYSCDHECS